MGKGKGKTMATAVLEIPTAPIPIQGKRCALCRRPFYAEDSRNLTERVLKMSRNPLVRFMRVYDQIDKTTISDNLARFVGQEKPIGQEETDILFDVLMEFCNGRERLASIVVAVCLEGTSYRAISDELGIDDKTVATIAKHGKIILDQLCAEARIRTIDTSS